MAFRAVWFAGRTSVRIVSTSLKCACAWTAQNCSAKSWLTTAVQSAVVYVGKVSGLVQLAYVVGSASIG